MAIVEPVLGSGEYAAASDAGESNAYGGGGGRMYADLQYLQFASQPCALAWAILNHAPDDDNGGSIGNRFGGPTESLFSRGKGSDQDAGGAAEVASETDGDGADAQRSHKQEQHEHYAQQQKDHSARNRRGKDATPILAVALSASLSIFIGARRLLQPPVSLADGGGGAPLEKQLTIVYTIDLYVHKPDLPTLPCMPVAPCRFTASTTVCLDPIKSQVNQKAKRLPSICYYSFF